MHITGLRLTGFKSFVDATELVIANGLTGVVGPNGCGKSNLLEALRWVMGETSYKTMRASTMDDVIFSGTQHRPARNSAEVTLVLDNSSRVAPAGFNDSDVLEITRRIERDSGSSYKINGNDVRARDVQLLFADASTGARSPALVQQGQIGQIVNSKPQARRRILEEAAGITGLHSRRHEAELRLKAAEGNLERLQDIMGQLGSRLNSLKRQARQAARYKELSTLIQQNEAIAFHLNWVIAGNNVNEAEHALQNVLKEVGLHTQAESEALRLQTDTTDALQPLRDEEATRAAVLHRLQVEQETLDKEEAALQKRHEELSTLLQTLTNDLTREESLITEGKDILERLGCEKQELLADTEGRADTEKEARDVLEAASEELETVEEELSRLTNQSAEHKASYKQLEQTITEQNKQLEKLESQKKTIDAQYEGLSEARAELKKIEELSVSVDQLAEHISGIEEQVLTAEQKHAEAVDDEKEKSQLANAANLKAQQLETEVKTLEKLLISAPSGEWPPIVDQLQVAPGYEQALGTSLGDDLDAPIDIEASVHWKTIAGTSDPTLPGGITPLSEFVKAPEQLARRLAQIGVVEKEQGQDLQKQMLPGQRLVTRQGDLWRWDGYSAAADAPTAAAVRLEERNRLDSLNVELKQALELSQRYEYEHQEVSSLVKNLQADEKQTRESWRAAQAELDRARSALSTAERNNQETNKKLAALNENKSHVASSIQEALERKQEAEAQLEGLETFDDIEQLLHEIQNRASQQRSVFSDARATLVGIEREGRIRQERLDTISQEQERWQKRSASAEQQLSSLGNRIEKTKEELTSFDDLPGQIAERREKLLNEISRSEDARKEAADRLANAENQLNSTNQSLRDVQVKLTQAKEERARAETRLETARERRSEQAQAIRDALSCSPEDCLKLAGVENTDDLPELREVESRLAKLKTDRERLGGVNLRAEEEATELSEQYGGMEKEREDLEHAIARLRQGIASLNREGRKRLLEAFQEVNAHFKRLFTTLFGGGEAELKLIESDDPLEAGLEIVAKPPGKKPQVLTLLSGGEKALTAMSLIFAVFLTNPSPICVLDEVDAPLDDSNVNRFCTLLEDMVKNTDTRFLTITHHPMTMARMSRLFGVTMSERGVSQLVSVDLATASSLREAS